LTGRMSSTELTRELPRGIRSLPVNIDWLGTPYRKGES
jgi:hypothetical protein